MFRRTTITHVLTLSAALTGCGEDDPSEPADSEEAGVLDGGSQDASALDSATPADGGTDAATADAAAGADCRKADRTCWSGTGVAEGCFGTGELRGTCSEENVQGTCSFVQSNNSVLVRFYAGTNGNPWVSSSSRTAQEECADLYKGTYTPK